MSSDNASLSFSRPAITPPRRGFARAHRRGRRIWRLALGDINGRHVDQEAAGIDGVRPEVVETRDYFGAAFPFLGNKAFSLAPKTTLEGYFDELIETIARQPEPAGADLSIAAERGLLNRVGVEKYFLRTEAQRHEIFRRTFRSG
jgi:hypothetical protein